MVWTVEGSQGYESRKIAHLTVPYMSGKGLDIGCGMEKVWPSCIGIDTGHHFGRGAANIDGNGSDLSLFSDGSLDYIFSSHVVEHIPEKEVAKTFKEWARALKPDGHLILYVPSSNLYPKVGAEGANPDHKWDIYPGDIERKLLEGTSCGWTHLESEERDKTNEYSLFEVFQKRSDGKFVKQIWERNPDGKKRALVIRYGAIGDQIMAASILPGLQKQGYHVTYNTTPEAANILKHDPHVDAFMMQEKDFVPNQELGPYWLQMEQEGRYDNIINLCESIEGTLLTLPGRLANKYSYEAKNRLYNVNYLERTHDIAGVPYDFHAVFYPSPKEVQEAKALREKVGDVPVIVWTIHGSAPHKVYPYTQVVLAWLLERTPAHIYLFSDAGVGRQLFNGIYDSLKEKPELAKHLSRIHGVTGTWNIRQSLAFAQQADVVVGPETGILNGVGFEKMPKVIMLSHSSAENLTKHWTNTTVLTPDLVECPCYPCHTMHYDWSSCHQEEETKASLCTAAIPPEKVFKAMMDSLLGQLATQAMESANGDVLHKSDRRKNS